MSAHVLLHLLNDLRRVEMWGFSFHLLGKG